MSLSTNSQISILTILTLTLSLGLAACNTGENGQEVTGVIFTSPQNGSDNQPENPTDPGDAPSDPGETPSQPQKTADIHLKIPLTGESSGEPVTSIKISDGLGSQKSFEILNTGNASISIPKELKKPNITSFVPGFAKLRLPPIYEYAKKDSQQQELILGKLKDGISAMEMEITVTPSASTLAVYIYSPTNPDKEELAESPCKIKEIKDNLQLSEEEQKGIVKEGDILVIKETSNKFILVGPKDFKCPLPEKEKE